ncbi:hypothetical protein ACLOJK_025728 [Asimina triloba]
MEGNPNLSQGNLIPGAPYGVLDLHGSMHVHRQQQQQTMVHTAIRDVFLQPVGNVNERERLPSIVDHGKGDSRKPSTSDDDEPSFTEDSNIDFHVDASKGKKSTPWQRMKWTNRMVRLLITAVSYLGEDVASEFTGGGGGGGGCGGGGGGRRKFAILQKKGKWKCISKVMAERGFYVSPQQCEDKFNDLNKRYKRLTDVLGRGTSCKVVENPGLLDLMSHLSDKLKEDVRKILSSKQLFYEEMCSYHNGNRIHLPEDPALQRSLQLALRSRDEHEGRGVGQDDLDEEEQEVETDYRDDEAEENGFGMMNFAKRSRVGQERENPYIVDSLLCNDSNRRSHIQSISIDRAHVSPRGAGGKEGWSQSQWTRVRLLQLEEQKLHIQVEALELEKQRVKWQRFSRKKDKELEKMRIENERMRLENEHMALELKRLELDSSCNWMVNGCA